MTQTELTARMGEDDQELRKTSLAYHLNRGVMEILEPRLKEFVGPDFTAYMQAMEDSAQAKSWAAYQAGKHLGEVAAKKELPVSVCDELPLEALIGNAPVSATLPALWKRVLAVAAGEGRAFVELYAQVASEVRTTREIRAGLWGLQASGAGEAWVKRMSGYLPQGLEPTDWVW